MRVKQGGSSRIENSRGGLFRDLTCDAGGRCVSRVEDCSFGRSVRPGKTDACHALLQGRSGAAPSADFHEAANCRLCRVSRDSVSLWRRACVGSPS